MNAAPVATNQPMAGAPAPAPLGEATRPVVGRTDNTSRRTRTRRSNVAASPVVVQVVPRAPLPEEATPASPAGQVPPAQQPVQSVEPANVVVPPSQGTAGLADDVIRTSPIVTPPPRATKVTLRSSHVPLRLFAVIIWVICIVLEIAIWFRPVWWHYHPLAQKKEVLECDVSNLRTAALNTAGWVFVAMMWFYIRDAAQRGQQASCVLITTIATIAFAIAYTYLSLDEPWMVEFENTKRNRAYTSHMGFACEVEYSWKLDPREMAWATALRTSVYFSFWAGVELLLIGYHLLKRTLWGIDVELPSVADHIQKTSADFGIDVELLSHVFQSGVGRPRDQHLTHTMQDAGKSWVKANRPGWSAITLSDQVTAATTVAMAYTKVEEARYGFWGMPTVFSGIRLATKVANGHTASGSMSA